MSANRSSNSTSSKHKKTKADEKEEQNDLDNAVMDSIIIKPTRQPGLRGRGKSIDPNSPGKKIVDKQMEQYASKAKEEKKKRELQAEERKS